MNRCCRVYMDSLSELEHNFMLYKNTHAKGMVKVPAEEVGTMSKISLRGITFNRNKANMGDKISYSSACLDAKNHPCSRYLP